MKVIVNLQNTEEERVLVAFLNSLGYDYQIDEDVTILTEEQQKEVLRRENAFLENKTDTRSWDEIREDLLNLFN